MGLDQSGASYAARVYRCRLSELRRCRWIARRSLVIAVVSNTDRPHESPRCASRRAILPQPLRGRDIWGATPIDQLLCRIRLHELRYERRYTPPSLEGTPVFPGNFGTFNRGGVAVDRLCPPRWRRCLSRSGAKCVLRRCRADAPTSIRAGDAHGLCKGQSPVGERYLDAGPVQPPLDGGDHLVT